MSDTLAEFALDGTPSVKLLESFLGKARNDIYNEISASLYKRFVIPSDIDWYGFALNSKVTEGRGGDLEIFDGCILLQFTHDKVTSACFVQRILQYWFDPATGRSKLDIGIPMLFTGKTGFNGKINNPCLLEEWR